MIQTKNFNPASDKKLLCTCGNSKCDKRSLSQFSLDNLQLIRNDYGKGMIVTSGGRCPYHKDELKKKKPGDHQLCYGVDIFYKTAAQRTKLMVLAGRHGATRVAWGKNFIHIAWTPTARLDVPTWSY